MPSSSSESGDSNHSDTALIQHNDENTVNTDSTGTVSNNTATYAVIPPPTSEHVASATVAKPNDVS